ncbi:MAG: immunoglobulin domain-containing protein [Opitutae bacterium]|nr:immunoglobulin domain-containing protein [Opitutae bacterium]
METSPVSSWTPPETSSPSPDSSRRFVNGTGADSGHDFLRGAVIDQSGNFYTAGKSAIRKVSPSGVVTIIAGSPTEIGSADGIGSSARFYYPSGLAVDQAENVYVADTFNRLVRKISPAGAVTTIAGQAGQRGDTDGVGAAARFSSPNAVAVDRAGNVYVADDRTIRFITPEGAVTTLAGKPGISGSDDGPDVDTRFRLVTGIALDSAGNLYVADLFNHAIRKGQLGSAPHIVTPPRSQTVAAGATVQLSVTATGTPDPAFQWYFNGAPFSGATTNTLSFTNARASDAGDYTVVVANALGTVTSNKATLTVTAAPAPAPAPAPASGGSGGGGGGAPSGWFFFALLAAAAVRRFGRSLAAPMSPIE